MKNIICIYICFLYLFFGIAQDNPWFLGYGAGAPGTNGVKMSFIGDTFNLENEHRIIGGFIGTASFSDTLSNLLFYTNGIVICNTNYDTMPHGNDMPIHHTLNDIKEVGYTFPNTLCALRSPSNPKQYYLLHPYLQGDTILSYVYVMWHYYSLIDMDMENGLGDVAIQNQVFQNDTTTLGTMAAVRHANGRDWWIVFNKFMSNEYYTYLLDPSGFSGPVIQKPGNAATPTLETFGFAQFTPDGTKYIHDAFNYGIKIIDFDRCTGLFSSNPTIIPFKFTIGSIIISPNSQVLYKMAIDSLFQYDLTASDVAASKQCVAVSDGFMIGNYAANFYNPGLAPNGKIYIGSRNGIGMLHVIDKPDILGSACNVIQHGVLLPMPNATVPTPPNYHLGVLSGSACDTITSYPSAVIREQVKVYPNPAKEMLYIEMPPTMQQATFGLQDITGKELLRQQIGSKATILVGKLPKGLYFYHVITDKQQSYGKLIIE